MHDVTCHRSSVTLMQEVAAVREPPLLFQTRIDPALADNGNVAGQCKEHSDGAPARNRVGRSLSEQSQRKWTMS